MKAAAATLLTLMLLDPRGDGGAGMRIPQEPAFKGGVDLVTLSVVVHNKDGRPVTGLLRSDFELFDAGKRQPILTFESEPAAISMALLFDVSGSMDVASKLTAGRDAVRHVVSWLEPRRDQVALFAFDTRLQELQPFTTSGADVLRVLGTLQAFGSTSLYDAIADTGRRLAAQGGARRAVVVVTDGADNRSQLTPGEVSGIASGLDVPVYVLVVVSPLDHPGTDAAVERQKAPTSAGALGDLARATGGALFMISAPAHASVAARQIVDELRHQYLIAFEPSARAGWHPVFVHTLDARYVVRARSGYVAGPRANRSH